MSARPLRVLLVEDSEDDATLLLRELKHGGFEAEARRTDTADATAAALADGGWDLMIADFSMPGFSGVEALKMVRAGHADLPVVFVSGTMGEEAAVRAMKLGASDYFVKGKLGRLCPAIERELRDAATRRERRLAEQALSESESRYKELFHANPHPTWVYDVESGALLAANDAAVREYGYTAEEVLGLTVGDLTGEMPVDGERDVASMPHAERHARKNGEVIEVEVSTHAIQFAGRRARLVVATDVSERHRLESELRQSQKMQAIGQLAGGIAHDFNNILSIIVGFGSDLLGTIAPDDPKHESVSQIVAAGERAALLTRQLLAFSRRQLVSPRTLDLNAVLGDMEPMVRRLMGADIELVFRRAPDLATVRADPAQIQQVVMNLVVNARDAMPTGGRLVVETTTTWVDEEVARRRAGLTAGAYSVVAVTDTGVGIAADVLPRIFEPFFTTKAVGQGTGLGLATVYAIVSGAGGHVEASSEPGRGTSFTIYLPCVDGVPDDARLPDSGVLPRGTERILVVEDEDGVRELVRLVLEPLGYTVVLAADPVEGQERARETAAGFALLVTDVVMPRGSGPELARALAATRPDLRVLYVSGYTTDAVVDRGGLGAGEAFLQKPFTPYALAQAVRTLLDGPAPASLTGSTV